MITSGHPLQQIFYKPGLATPWLTNTLGSVDGMGAAGVMQQSFAGGQSFSYTYENMDPGISEPPRLMIGVARGTGWVENGQASTILAWDSSQLTNDGPLRISPAPVSVTDPLGRTTLNAFQGGAVLPYGKLAWRRSPSGRLESFSYGQGGALSERRIAAPQGSGLDDIVQGFTYDCSVLINCAKPVTATDPRGNVTNYTYDTTHGGVLTETLPAGPNGVRPQKRYTYGQFSAWFRNSSGQLVAGTPVWLVTSISECRTQSSCAGTADETVTTFNYGPAGTANNLLPISQTVSGGGLSATTTWTYDANGDRLTEDGPLPGAADTTRWRYDSMRRVIGVIGPDPDGAGPLKHRAVRNTYDAAGRLIKVENGTVNDQSDPGWAAFAALDAIDYQYDLLDRPIRETRSSGGVVHAVSQTSYDLYGRVECVAVRMNPAAYGSLPASACTLGAQGSFGPDRITRNVYDLAGQLLQVRRGVGTSVEAAEGTFGYTVNGQRNLLIDANGNRADGSAGKAGSADCNRLLLRLLGADQLRQARDRHRSARQRSAAPA